MNSKKHLITTLLVAAVLILNLLLWQNSWLGIIFGVLYISLFSRLLGFRLFSQFSEVCLKWTLGFITLLATISLTGTVFFYLWELGNLQLVLVTVLPLIILLTPANRRKNSDSQATPSSQSPSNSPTNPILATSTIVKLTRKALEPILYLIFAATGFVTLFNHTTTDAIRTPWEVVPSSFLVVYFIATVILLLILLKTSQSEDSLAGSIREKTLMQSKKERLTALSGQAIRSSSLINSPTLKLLLISAHLFLTYSVALIVYQINFGFDPFIHQAGEKLLSLTGTISPKPLLYIGQYSLVTWLSKVFTAPIVLIDKLLVPALSALLLPVISFFALNKGFGLKQRSALIASAAFPLLLIPFFFTVPQNLANLILLLTVFLTILFLSGGDTVGQAQAGRTLMKSNNEGSRALSRDGSQAKPIWFLWLLGLTTLAVHPFSGLPALIFLALLTVSTAPLFTNLNKKIRTTLFVLIIIGSLIALPLAISIGSSSTGQLPATAAGDSSLNVQIANWVPFYSIFHLVYFFKLNHVLILGVLALLGVWLLFKKTDQIKSNRLIVMTLVTTFLILAIDSLALKHLNLPIISYELPEFIARFWQIGLLFLTPIILFAIGKIINQILGGGVRTRSIAGRTLMKSNNKGSRALSRTNSRAFQIALILFLALFLTSSTYLLYPRHDAFTTGRAFATSSSDIEAVRWIEQDAQGQNYVVLSNQAVAAAALQEFGFKKYYQPQPSPYPLFYYPIPTTSPTYRLYLDMVYQAPTKKRLREALELTGADIAYFVINDYWLDSQQIVAAAANEFAQSSEINDGAINIFKLTK